MTLPAQSLASFVRRKRIVDAAQRKFSSTPYELVQMDDVARAAGVAKPTIYRYFATKEDLFLESLDGMLEALGGEAEQAVQAAKSAETALAAGIAIVLGTLGRCTAAIRAFDGSDTRLGDRGRAIIRERVKNIRNTFAEVVERGIQSGEFRSVDPEVASLTILGAVRMSAAHISAKRHMATTASLIDFFRQGLVTHDPLAAPNDGNASP
jgi:TetR/AcrR family transcriptional repressor of mexJK operon